MSEDKSTFEIYDFDWPSVDNIDDGIVVMRGGKCVEAMVKRVEADDREEAMRLFYEGEGEVEGYVLENEVPEGAIVIPFTE